MLSVRLPISSKLLIKSRRSKKFYVDFDCAGVGTPTPKLFKGQLYLTLHVFTNSTLVF